MTESNTREMVALGVLLVGAHVALRGMGPFVDSFTLWLALVFGVATLASIARDLVTDWEGAA